MKIIYRLLSKTIAEFDEDQVPDVGDSVVLMRSNEYHCKVEHRIWIYDNHGRCEVVLELYDIGYTSSYGKLRK